MCPDLITSRLNPRILSCSLAPVLVVQASVFETDCEGSNPFGGTMQG